MTTELRGRLITPHGIIEGSTVFGTLIHSVHSASAAGPYILPGFIATHVHGGGGGDTIDGEEGVRRIARFHLNHDTTTLYLTTITNHWEKIVVALQGVKAVQQGSGADLPDIPGAHLESPFIIRPHKLKLTIRFGEFSTALGVCLVTHADSA